MANVVVVGAQWGDEGKGKIVDWLSVGADVVVRFQGGHNAGHTLVIDGKVFKLALLPSGIVRPGKLSIIGNGVVLDPYHLVDEIEKLRGQGVEVTPDNLKIAENVPLILSLHRELDAHRESASARGTKIGTTKRGIGPAYEDKVARRAIRLMDLAEPDALDDKIERLLAHHDPLCRGLGLPRAERERDPRRTARGRAEDPAVHGADLRPARPRAARGQAHPVRGRAGRAARRRSRHLSVRHLVEHRRRQRGDRIGHGPGRDRLRARHRQGLRHPRRRGAVPDRAGQRHRPADRRARQRVRHQHRPARGAAAGSTPCSPARPRGPAASTGSP